MAYTSRPDYLDPPNWNQPPPHQQRNQLIQQAGGSTGGGEPHQLLPPLPDGGAAIRPNSMAERARLAKIPMPEHALKCPRCDSTNTKFCYFNNYSLSQPRHFCKTCRRYWTRGGALRNVPVGGGCRRNKRSKSSSSKSMTSELTKSASSTGSGPQPGLSGAISSGLLPPSHLPLLAPFSDYGVSSMGLNYGGIQQLDPADYNPVASNSMIGIEHWRQLQNFPCFTGLEATASSPSPGMYQFNVDSGDTAPLVQGKATCGGLITQLASVKMEESNNGAQGLNLPRHFLSLPGNDQYWSTTINGGAGTSLVGGSAAASAGAAAWTDLSGISSASTGSLL